jgi:hypothetical protein
MRLLVWASFILFVETNNTSRKLYDIKTAASRSAFSTSDSSVIDPKDLDKVLTEQALISQRTTFFSRFFNTRVKDQVDAIDGDVKFDQVLKELGYNQKTGVLTQGKLELRVDNMIGSEYLPLEGLYAWVLIGRVLHTQEYGKGIKVG